MPAATSKSKSVLSGAPPKNASLNSSGRKIVRYRGHKHLRQRLILSILSGKSVRIDGIREDEVEVGLKDYEVSLLRLLEKITNGTTIEISYTGTTLLMHPGLLPGGTYTHTCPLSRPIGYYLELLLALAPFGKKPLDIKLEGITGEEGRDMSVDMIRTVSLPTLHMFGITEGLELMIKKRGAAPGGGGLVIFKCPVVKTVKTLDFVDPGKIKRIRGIAYSTRVSPQFANRMVEAARSVLNRYIPDIYLYTDVYKGEESGKSPGYGLTLLSQSTTSALHTHETISLPPPSRSTPSSTDIDPPARPEFQTPEDLALNAARGLLEQISRGGCVDEGHQWLVALLMVLGTEDVGRCRIGKVSAYTVQWLRDINDFFGVRFKITPVTRHHAGNIKQLAPGENAPSGTSSTSSDDEDEQEKTIMGIKVKGVVNKETDQVKNFKPEEYVMSCVGIGYGNINRSTA